MGHVDHFLIFPEECYREGVRGGKWEERVDGNEVPVKKRVQLFSYRSLLYRDLFD